MPYGVCAALKGGIGVMRTGTLVWLLEAGLDGEENGLIKVVGLSRSRTMVALEVAIDQVERFSQRWHTGEGYGRLLCPTRAEADEISDRINAAMPNAPAPARVQLWGV